jgi:excisionase family DNA binding protein
MLGHRPVLHSVDQHAGSRRKRPRRGSCQQAAEYLGVSERTIKRWIWNGQLKPSKPGGDYGKCYLKPADLDDLMEKSRAR